MARNVLRAWDSADVGAIKAAILIKIRINSQEATDNGGIMHNGGIMVAQSKSVCWAKDPPEK